MQQSKQAGILEQKASHAKQQEAAKGIRQNIVADPQINFPLLSENRRQSQRTVSGNMITVRW